jgi:hypothetical protein
VKLSSLRQRLARTARGLSRVPTGRAPLPDPPPTPVRPAADGGGEPRVVYTGPVRPPGEHPLGGLARKAPPARPDRDRDLPLPLRAPWQRRTP